MSMVIASVCWWPGVAFVQGLTGNKIGFTLKHGGFWNPFCWTFWTCCIGANLNRERFREALMFHYPCNG